MSREVLIISTTEDAESCAAIIAERLGSEVHVAPSRKAGLQTLKRTEYAVVVVEEGLIEGDPEWADQIWEHVGTAITLQVNFSISGCSRLGREVKAALMRRDAELAVARKAALAQIEVELRSSLTGLLLQSELVLQQPAIPPELEPKLRHLLELAGAIREKLRPGTT